jgi:hypothetical protein
MIWISSPVLRSTSSRNSGPSSASRTAAVATVRSGETPIPLASAAKRRSATIARTRPSGFRRPVSENPAPRPQRIFSLKK